MEASFIEQYLRERTSLLADPKICPENRRLFREFLEWEERKLKRMNGLPKVDDRSAKTLTYYVRRFRNVNAWFRNKPWRKLGKADIQRVYDDLEDGKITTRSGTPFLERRSYYNKIFRSKPFELAGKAELAREVLEFASPKADTEVRFITEESFRKIVALAHSPHQKALLWLAFDIGENILTLLDLQRKDFKSQLNPVTKEPEYVVNLARDKLKRSRTPRSEISNYRETAQCLDVILEGLDSDARLFAFAYRQALKFLSRAGKASGVRCQPNGETVSWKDLRSSMACDLLTKGWSTDEIKARLGHKPSSRILDKYVNYMAIGRHQSKKKLYDNDLQRVADEVKGQKELVKQLNVRQEELRVENERLKGAILELEPLVLFYDSLRRDRGAIKAMRAMAASMKANRSSETESAKRTQQASQ